MIRKKPAPHLMRGGHRFSLRPLISQGPEFKAKLARIARRDREAVSSRHCEERKRRSNPAFFLPLNGLLRFARNDSLEADW
jgi:hypothetical protein